MPQIKKDRTGEVFEMKDGIKATIIEYRGAKDVDVMLSNGVVIPNITVFNLLNNGVGNQYEKSICGIGYLGLSRKTTLRKKAYTAWSAMIKRCYDGKEINYLDCEVSEHWHNFSNFLDWYSSNYFKGCCVDKDLKVKGNRVYSEETCIMVPKEINNLIINNKRGNNNFIGVRKCYNKFVATFDNTYIGIFFTELEAFLCYKETREAFIKDMALLYYSNGLISVDCYDSLNKWTINPTD